MSNTLQFRLNSRDQARLTRVHADLGNQSEADTYLQCMRMIEEIIDCAADHSPVQGRRGLDTVITIHGTHGGQKCPLGGLNGA